MKTIKFLIKISAVLLIYILTYGFFYAIYISKTGNDINLIASFICNCLMYAILGLGYANHFQKKGLLIGMLSVIIHFFLLTIIYYISKNEFNFNALKIIIIILCGGIGGLLGGNIKKIF